MEAGTCGPNQIATFVRGTQKNSPTALQDYETHDICYLQVKSSGVGPGALGEGLEREVLHLQACRHVKARPLWRGGGCCF